MSEYTPQTDMVRYAWIDRRDFEAQVQHVVGYTDEDYGNEFDRWFNAERAKVWNEAYQAGAFDTLGSPGDAQNNPYEE